jgi:ribose-phosphate pyrophosphokinase
MQAKYEIPKEMIEKAIIFSGSSHPSLAKEVAELTGVPLGQVSIEPFPDGEISLQIGQNVRGRETFVFQSVALDPNYYLMELLIMIDALKRASALSITVVMPYFGYCRQDRKDKPRVPITAKLVANMLTQAGATRVLTVDLHAGQIQGFFDIPVDNISGRPSLVKAFKDFHSGKVKVVAPDIGSIKLGSSYARDLNTDLAVIDKTRINANQVECYTVVGDIEGVDVLLADDLCSTAGTLVSAAKACQEKGAKRIFAAITHALLVKGAVEKIEQSPIDALFISDTVPVRPNVINSQKYHIVSLADPLAKAISCIFSKESISCLYR